MHFGRQERHRAMCPDRCPWPSRSRDGPNAGPTHARGRPGWFQRSECIWTEPRSAGTPRAALALSPARAACTGQGSRGASALFQERGVQGRHAPLRRVGEAPHARGLRISRDSADTNARLLGDAVPRLARVAGVERLRRQPPAGTEAGPTTTSARATELLAVTLASVWAESHLVHVGLSMAAAPRVANLSGLLLAPSDRRRGDSHSSDVAARSDLWSARSVLRSTVG